LVDPKLELERMAIVAGIAVSGLKRETIAVAEGISPSRFSKMLHGKIPMPGPMRKRLLEQFGLTKAIETATCELGLMIDLGTSGAEAEP
jgi:hypothetical protein